MPHNVQELLRERFRRIKKERSLNLRQINEETGITFSTLSRFDCGRNIDTDLALRLSEWLNIGPSEAFGLDNPKYEVEDILTAIQGLILSDENIPIERRQSFADWFYQTYRAYEKNF